MDYWNLDAQFSVHVRHKAYFAKGFSLTSSKPFFPSSTNKTLAFHHQPVLGHTYLMFLVENGGKRLEPFEAYMENSPLDKTFGHSSTMIEAYIFDEKSALP